MALNYWIYGGIVTVCLYKAQTGNSSPTYRRYDITPEVILLDYGRGSACYTTGLAQRLVRSTICGLRIPRPPCTYTQGGFMTKGIQNVYIFIYLSGDRVGGDITISYILNNLE